MPKKGKKSHTKTVKKSVQLPSLATTKKSVGAVRIVGGQFKRTPLAVMDREGMRPTPDRVRETVFDWLLHLEGGTLENLAVLDLFAGSGAMGLEAISRGASKAVLTELNRNSAQLILTVVKKLKIESQVTVLCADAFGYLSESKDLFDIVFIDPPFAAGVQEEALKAVISHLNKEALVYVESPYVFEEATLKACGYESVRRGKAGAVFYLLARPVSP